MGGDRRLAFPSLGPVRSGAENLASTGIRPPDRLARSELLYRIRYPGPPTILDVHELYEMWAGLF